MPSSPSAMNEIWHGDCRDLIPKLPDPIHCLIFDPPYGVNFRSRRAELPQGKRFVQDIAGDDKLESALALFSVVFTALAEKVGDTGEAYVFTRWDVVGPWISVVNELAPVTGFAYKMLLIWDKGIPGMGDIDCNWGCGHELILYLKKGRREVPFRRSGIIAVNKLGSKQHIHPTEKPVPLLEQLIAMSTDPGDLVVDPFSGSGSSIVAAQNLGRQGIGIEKDDEFIERSRVRLQQTAMVF